MDIGGVWCDGSKDLVRRMMPSVESFEFGGGFPIFRFFVAEWSIVECMQDKYMPVLDENFAISPKAAAKK